MDYLKLISKYRDTDRTFKIIIFLTILLMIIFIISLGLGRFHISVIDIINIILQKIIKGKLNNSAAEAVIFNVRLPRILFAILIGASLSLAGLCYQSVFKNPLVSADVIGASSGASFGAALAIVFGYEMKGISISSFLWSIVAVFIVYIVSKAINRESIVAMVLSGFTIGSLFKSGLSFIKVISDPLNELPQITYWLMGSLTTTKLSLFLPSLIGIIIASIPIWICRWKINVITMGDDEAKSMGINVSLIRAVIVMSATFLTAICIANAGIIGWISLAIPHFSRILVGNDFRKLMPITMLMGANFLLIVDNISRILFSVEIPLGILTSVVGVPMFFIVVYRKRRII